MATRLLIFIFLIVLVSSFTRNSNSGVTDRDENVNEVVHAIFEANSLEFISKLELLKSLLKENNFDSISLNKMKSIFLECRNLYKINELFSTYFFPTSDLNCNGPVISEVEYEDEPKQMIVKPTGLQVIEVNLYSNHVAENSNEIIKQISHLIDIYSSLTNAFHSKKVNEKDFVEAMRTEVDRHFSLGIANFDTPISRNSFEEIKQSLTSLGILMRLIYSDKPSVEIENIKNQLNDIIEYLNKFKFIEDVDLLFCLSKQYVPFSIAISDYFYQLPKTEYTQSTALRPDQQSIFDKRGFNAFFYNQRGENKNYSVEVAELGKLLFFDPILSLNNKRACASCHRADMAFTDQLPTSAGFHAGKSVSRNAPTILNVALQRNYFWDNRSTDLEDQVGQVIFNSNEMKSSYDLIIEKLNSSEEYKSIFKKYFSGTEDTVINKFSISNAIAEYERKLIAMNSKFDKNVRGELNDFTADEKLGFQIFMTKGNCASCHYLPMFSGLVPPNYTKSEFENIGTTKTADFLKPVFDSDSGRGARYRTSIYVGSFKTPTLRNVALTFPYMHNGAFKTLEQVVDFYNEGGGAGLGLDVPNQTLNATKLNLTALEKSALISFLFTLTDTIAMTNRPNRLPLFPKNSILNTRVVGGEY